MPLVTTALGDVQSKPFPGHVVKLGDPDDKSVKFVQRRLNAVGCGPIAETGVFEKETEGAVKVFQARFPDVTGRPLVVDGKVGAITWGALFGAAAVPSVTTPPSALTRAALAEARAQIGVMENPLGSNRGPEVDEYVRAVGLNPTGKFAWCVAFTHFCYLKAAASLGVPNPHIKTAGVIDHWNKAKAKAKVGRITHAAAIANPALVTPGSLFIIDTGGGHGHTGMVVEVADGRLVTIEGNTNPGGSANGIGVFLRDARKIASISKGFIDYSAF